MSCGRLRRWINRDDGRWYRVGNRNLRWYQVLGCLLYIGALFWLQLAQRINSVLPMSGKILRTKPAPKKRGA